MIRMIQSANSGHAKSYFNEALSKGDYYLDGQELGGKFHGKLADRLNLSGAIEKDDFYRLCENINPNTGESLTPRTKVNRTIGYDINFHCPKSVSILNALGDDKRVLNVFRDSVNETMLEIEKDIRTRVRIDGKMDERNTGELIWGEFVHQTARPVDGSPPDPHLHTHCYVLNATWDDTEQKYKAGQFRDIKRDMPYYQACFQKRLSDKLNKIGYETRMNEKAFEVTVIPEKAVQIFSKRTDAIGQFAKENDITSRRQLDQLGARTRAKKEKGYTMQELREHWKDQVSHIGKSSASSNGKGGALDKTLSAQQCVSHAVKHCFERKSVVEPRTVLRTAIAFGMKNPELTQKEIINAFNAENSIVKVEEHNRQRCTTLEVFKEERTMVNLARQSKGRYVPINAKVKNKDFENLNPQQINAVRQVLESTDGVTIIRGGAGTGKTTMMKQAVKAIEEKKLKVYSFAPSSESARDVLRGEGFDNADTVAKLLLDKNLQEQTKGQVIWVDEAGLLSTKDMGSVLKVANENNARLVLSGDTRQHASVRRGDALRILRTVGDVKVAGVDHIYRQRVEQYKLAVQDISEGMIEKGFKKLDDINSIVEKPSLEINTELVQDFLDCHDAGKTSLIITPTREHSEAVNLKIREQLKERGVLQAKERSFTQFKNKNLTDAQKMDTKNYRIGEVVQFHQHVKGIKKSSKLSIKEVTHDEVILQRSKDDTVTLPISKPEFYDVYSVHELNLTQGDSLKITQNGFDNHKNRLDNGKLLTVKGFDRYGNIKAVSSGNQKGKELLVDKNFGNLSYGYVMTSHASQGKTVDKVFIVQPSATFPASNAKQFYVSVSRGREEVKIYTDSKEELLDTINVNGDRLSATELRTKHTQEFEHHINVERTREQFNEQKQDFKNTNNHGWEPEL